MTLILMRLIRDEASSIFDHFRQMLFRGAINYNIGLMSAAWRGHLDNVLLILQQGADDFNGAMVMAAHRGHEDIVRLMKLHITQV